MSTKEENQHFWERVKELGRQNVKPGLYDYFIEPAKLLGIEDNVVEILVESSYHQDFWKKQSDLIRTAGVEIFEKVLDYKLFSEDELTEKDIQKLSPNNESVTNIVERPAKRLEPINSRVNVHKTFENFIQGPGNRMSLGAAIAVADTPGGIYNPLFIWGGSGFGKTHLMYAIGNEMMKDNPNARVMYASSENFLADYVSAARDNALKKFEETYRNLDLLLLDDVQFFGKNQEATRTELFNTFQALYEKGAQIVLTSDRPPEELNNLEDRLVSRFSWGLTTDITAPDYETRMAILMKKAEQLPLEFPQDTLGYIAGQIDSNVRALEGALNSVEFYARTNRVNVVDVETASQALRTLQNTAPQPLSNLSVKKVQEVVAKHFQIAVSDLTGPKRTKEIAVPRQIAMYLIRELMNLSLPAIGSEFGGRDHTTVMHSHKKISELMTSDQNLQKEMDVIKQELK